MSWRGGKVISLKCLCVSVFNERPNPVKKKRKKRRNKDKIRVYGTEAEQGKKERSVYVWLGTKSTQVPHDDDLALLARPL